ncbi:hypothetical protein ACFW1F_15485 [Streptomyces bungoensis]|uniref:hypothetical protein n=1 Tax=Streptomyces bungoensis TaxID=285568 RepID=UPI00342E82DA
MRTFALRTKTVLVALTGAGVMALGITAAAPSTGVEQYLAHLASGLSPQAQSGPVLADDHGPRIVQP